MVDIKLLKQEIDNHKIISFDVFDTLILRPFIKPEHIYDYIEEKYSEKGFSKYRKNIIIKDKEKSIEDIYEKMPTDFKYLLSVELEEEKSLFYPNDNMKECFRYAVNKNKIVVILSDIHFHERFLREALKESGIEGFVKLYCSCDYNKTKCSGELFELLISDFNAIPRDVLHIGDNNVSDFAVPKSLGIDSFLINQNASLYAEYRDYIFEDSGSFWNSIIDKVSADNFSKDIRSVSDESYCWYRFGFDEVGPICWAFSKWLHSIVIENKEISDLAFIARDGYLIKKMFDLLPPVNYVNTHYVYAPRLLSTLFQSNYKNRRDIQLLSDEEKKNLETVFELKNASEEDKMLQIKSLEDAYRLYLKEQHFGKGVIGVVDSTTNNLSSQKLISIFGDNKTIGLYWFASHYACMMGYDVLTAQISHEIAIESDSLFELVFKSPESTIKGISKSGEVEFNEISEDERQRIANFKEIEKGAMQFFNDIEEKKIDKFPSAEIVNYHLSRFCNNPRGIEKEVIESGRSSGGIANNIWTPTKVFTNNTKKRKRKSLFSVLKTEIAKHPKLFVFLRDYYHKIRRIN